MARHFVRELTDGEKHRPDVSCFGKAASYQSQWQPVSASATQRQNRFADFDVVECTAASLRLLRERRLPECERNGASLQRKHAGAGKGSRRKFSPTEVDEADFITLSDGAVETMLARVAELLRSMANPNLLTLAECFLIDETFMKGLRSCSCGGQKPSRLPRRSC